MPIIKLNKVNYTYENSTAKFIPLGIEEILFNTDTLIKAEKRNSYTHIQYREGVIVNGFQCTESLKSILKLINAQP